MSKGKKLNRRIKLAEQQAAIIQARAHNAKYLITPVTIAVRKALA